ncbi:MAG: ABC transporter permease [Candidatus Spechtbacteria bacterium]|nr:ABC transporter permease [Candidatus Spechtbacteria bacterium]
MAVILLFLFIASTAFFVLYEAKLKSLERIQGRTIVISATLGLAQFSYEAIKFIFNSLVVGIKAFVGEMVNAGRSRQLGGVVGPAISPRVSIIRAVPTQRPRAGELIIKAIKLPGFLIGLVINTVVIVFKVVFLGVLFIIGGVFKLFLLSSRILAEGVACVLRRLRFLSVFVASTVFNAIERSPLPKTTWFERIRAGLAKLKERGEVQLKPISAEKIDLSHFASAPETKMSISAVKVEGGAGLTVIDLLYLATHTFVARPMRTFLTILGMSVGLGTVLLLVSLGYGLQEVLLQRIASSDVLLTLDVMPGAEGRMPVTREHLAVLASIDGVAEISPELVTAGQVDFDSISSEAVVHIVEPDYFILNGDKSSLGHFFTEQDPSEGLVVTTALANLFDVKDVSGVIGKPLGVQIFVPKLSEEGVLEVLMFTIPSSKPIIGVIDNPIESAVYASQELAKDVAVSEYTGAKVRVGDSSVLESVRGAIVSLGFTVSAIADTIDQAQTVFRILQIILAFFGLAALIVSAIGMFNTMTISLLERTNEIGILKALGATQNDIRRMFLVESFLMGFLGGLGGLAIGYGLGYLVNIGMGFLARALGGDVVNIFSAPTWFVGIILFMSPVIGTLTGFWPAQRAAAMHPLAALRYK